MKSIKNGQRYNTETATEIAWWSNTEDRSNFHYTKEILYRTTAGSFFLHGIGGAASEYAIDIDAGRSRSGSSDIKPLTNAEALAWLELHGEIEAIEEHFSDQLQDA